MKKINDGYTNISYKKGNIFYQEKVKNGFNHKLDYRLLQDFNFVPKLISNNKENVEWEWIDGKNLIDIKNEDLIQIAKILKQLHQSKLDFPKSNIRQRIDSYRSIMNKKGIKIEIVNKMYKKINSILRNMDRSTPVHGDLWSKNIIKKTNDNKIYFVDWEYAHKGDKHFELAYFIESFDLNEEKEKTFLDAYIDYDPYILKKHKVLINYLTILWLYSNEKLFYSPQNCIKKLIKFDNEGF